MHTRDRHTINANWNRLFLTVVPVVLILVAFALIYIWESQQEFDESLSDFRLLSLQTDDKVRFKFEEQESLLEQITALFAQSDNNGVARNGFHQFVEKSLSRFPMIQALSWVPRVTDADRARFETSQHKDIPHFEIRERDSAKELIRASHRDTYYPVTFIEPLIGNESAVGFDLYSNEHRRAAIVKSIETDALVMTEPITLVQERQHQQGVLLIHTVSLRGKQSGVVSTVLRMGDFMAELLESSHSMIYTRLSDLDSNKILYDDSGTQAMTPLYEHEFEFGTRHLKLETAPTSVYFSKHRRWLSSTLIISGLAISSLVGLLFYSISGTNARIKKQVEERTRQLGESESKFRVIAEQSVIGIYTHESGAITYLNPCAAAIFGYKTSELIGKSPEIVIAEEDIEKVRDIIRCLLSGESIKLDGYEIKGKRKDGSGVLINMFASIVKVGNRNVVLGIVQDITNKSRSEQVIRDYIARIERMILGTVDAISRLVELRDPYTAGHERRVGQLAAAIAAEMGLDENIQTGLRVAGAVHDVGKVAIPSEILTMPRRLTNLEYELVKEHAEQGYEILHKIDSPWPIAEVAWQHHERMDGSGYPHGLKGENILLEARIVAVADVVESMTSSRPYRPGLGYEKALEEIETNSGKDYDSSVVEACLRLFREKGYLLPE